MLDINRLYELDIEVCARIQSIKKEREAETKSFILGMEQGADLFLKVIREELKKEDTESGGVIK